VPVLALFVVVFLFFHSFLIFIFSWLVLVLLGKRLNRQRLSSELAVRTWSKHWQRQTMAKNCTMIGFVGDAAGHSVRSSAQNTRLCIILQAVRTKS
jgi:hypothetical protein